MARARSQAAIHAVVWTLIAIITVLAATPADARRHYTRRGHASQSQSSYSPPYSAIVVDVNSGATLHESSPDSQRHPASLTKIMTLYLLFEQLDIGKVALDSKIEVSEHCASRAPTKLDIPAGGSIRVEDAIKALVTKSANDVACAIGEADGGVDEGFARISQKKAHALVRSRTIYRNASGLPNDEQVTTARDQATLGRAIQDRFPRYYRYFATQSFTYRGRAIRNHNHLLGSVEGVDGIKTGFVQASGFNLVTSVRRNGRHLVAVVLGGRTAGARDSSMRELIAQYINKGNPQRSAPMVAEGSTRGASKPAAAEVSLAKTAAPAFVAAAVPPAAKASAVQHVVSQPSQADVRSEATAAAMSAQVGSSEDIRPIPVKTLKVRATSLKSSAIGSAHAQTAAATAAPAAQPGPVAEAAPEPATQIAVEPPAVTPAVDVSPARAARQMASVVQPAMPDRAKATERVGTPATAALLAAAAVVEKPALATSTSEET